MTDPLLTPAQDRRRARLLALFLLGYVLVLGFFLLAPTSTTPAGVFDLVTRTAIAGGLPSSLVTFDRVELAANVAVFVPPLAATLLLRPRWRWVDGVAYGFGASLAVELVQALFLSARWATVSDVVANTLGAALGAAIGVWWRGRSRPDPASLA